MLRVNIKRTWRVWNAIEDWLEGETMIDDTWKTWWGIPWNPAWWFSHRALLQTLFCGFLWGVLCGLLFAYLIMALPLPSELFRRATGVTLPTW